jgi:hypothetical protein
MKLRSRSRRQAMPHLRVLPVIVTAKTAAEVKPDVEAAERLGVLVLTRENLERAVDRTLLMPDPDPIYTEAEQAVRAALSKYQALNTQPSSNLIPPGQ